MKKLLVLLATCLFLSSSQAASVTEEELALSMQQVWTGSGNSLKRPMINEELSPEIFVDLLLKEIGSTSLSFLELPFWAKMRCLGAGAFGTIAGNLTAVAFLNLVGYNEQVKMPQPGQWGKMEWLGTVGGASAAIAYAYYAEYLSGIAKRIDAPLLVLALKNKGEESLLMKDLNSYFITQQFPNMAAFTTLEKNRSKLSYVFELLTKLEVSRQKTTFSDLKANVTIALEALDFAMLTVKNDPRWLQECSAHAMTMASQSMQANNDAQFASAIISLAHSRRR